VLIFLQWVVAYVGPETAMPFTSLLATLAALVLLFGKNLCRLVHPIFAKESSAERRTEGQSGLTASSRGEDAEARNKNGGRGK
jgi:hypothetical protein